MTGLAGWDLNGGWDWAASQDSEAVPSIAIRLVDGGIDPAVVCLQPGSGGSLVGGAAATLAPHGRGGGWGDVGRPDRRLRIADALAAPDAFPDPHTIDPGRALVTALAAMAPGARAGFLAIPDHDGFDEEHREARLRRLRQPRAPSITLLWRPIAVVLGWIARNPEVALPWGGTRVAVLVLGAQGVNIADMLLVKDQGLRGDVLAPERQRPGVMLAGAWAGRCLAGHTAAQTEIAISRSHDGLLREAFAERRLDLVTQARTPWLMASGQTAPPEPIRLPNGVWRLLPKVSTPSCRYLPAIDPMELDGRLTGADHILVAGPFVENAAWQRQVLGALGVAADDRRVVIGAPSDAARGCLEAAQRRAQGDPIYFDHLPQLEINALVDGDPKFVTLIAKGERVRGGQPYRGAAASDFALPKGASAVQFYLIKEDKPWPRHWTADISANVPTSTHELQVTVEQEPGQGRARVTLHSDSYAPFRTQPHHLDWDTMTVIERSRDDILRELADAAASRRYPNARPFPGHGLAWSAAPGGGPVCEVLQAYLDLQLPADGRIPVGQKRILDRLVAAFRQKHALAFLSRKFGLPVQVDEDLRAYCLGTDGTLPPSIPGIDMPDAAPVLLDAALAKAEQDIAALAMHQEVPSARAALGTLLNFTTWCFARAPNTTATQLRAIADREIAGIPTGINFNVIFYGLGRISDSDDAIRAAFDRLHRHALQGKAKIHHLRGIGLLLAFRERAARLLTPRQADDFLRWGGDALAGEIEEKTYKQLFAVLLQMIGALCRYRMVNPDFMDRNTCRHTRNIYQLLKAANVHLSNNNIINRDFARFSNAILDYIDSKGSSPNILINITSYT
ncbi:MAG: hypothetical protein H6843_04785 [Rhodospirillaceae bacterium]|nr:hypothetical protein [Rhodospirillaceae bacterium]